MVSLLHDVIVTVGVFSALQLQFDLTIVAALLTIIGFSINDTVVVFDRVRENLRKYKKMPLRDVMNLALNETLSRTMMTVVTTLIALFALLFFGGPVTFGFAFAVIFGIVRRHLFLDLGGERHRAPARGEARLVEARRQGGHPVRQALSRQPERRRARGVLLTVAGERVAALPSGRRATIKAGPGSCPR